MNFYGRGIIRSMLIAYKNLFRPVITVQYPHERVELPERSRWAVAMKHDADGSHKCTACMACERACPDYIIDIDVTTSEDRSKHINRWRYEIGACMMCGLCVEACSFDAIEMSHEYELARIDPAQLTVDLLEDTPAAKPKRKEPVAKPAAPAVDGTGKPEVAVTVEPASPNAPQVPEQGEGADV